MIAFHYPPMQGSSGIQRTLAFSRHLPAHGWQPLVLSAHPRAYAATSADQLGEIPQTAVVRRAFALDTARHLAVRGNYPRFLALPDRWIAWAPGAILAGMRLIRRYRPDVLWSTYPIATAHLIGWALARWSGLPWIADFRDSMTEDDYPPDPTTRRIYRAIEQRTVTTCRHAVFTTPGAVRMYAGRYPLAETERFVQIANGYDEENFRAVEERPAAPPTPDRPVRLVHSGVLYPSERDPTAFFSALAALKGRHRLTAGDVRVVLRASGSEAYHRQRIDEHGLGDIVELAPAVPYAEALKEMMEADGLLVFQAASCNHQIPAKVYEYLRARRPILGLTHPAGDTAALLRDAGCDALVPLDDQAAIEHALLDFIACVRAGTAPIPPEAGVARHSRGARTAELARLLDQCVAS